MPTLSWYWCIVLCTVCFVSYNNWCSLLLSDYLAELWQSMECVSCIIISLHYANKKKENWFQDTSTWRKWVKKYWKWRIKGFCSSQLSSFHSFSTSIQVHFNDVTTFYLPYLRIVHVDALSTLSHFEVKYKILLEINFQFASTMIS